MAKTVIMGVVCELEERSNENGALVELYRGESASRWFLKLHDIDADKPVGIQQYQTEASARKDYKTATTRPEIIHQQGIRR